MKYTVKQYFNGIYWDESYTDDKAEAERWKKELEDNSNSIWDRVNWDALEWFIKDFHITDVKSIEITAEIVEN